MNTAAKAEAATILSHAIHDRSVVEELRAILRASLNGALNLCELKASTLHSLDAKALMIALRYSFDPRQASQVQDCFSDGFHAALVATRDGESILDKPTLPSGVAK